MIKVLLSVQAVPQNVQILKVKLNFLEKVSVHVQHVMVFSTKIKKSLLLAAVIQP